MSRQLTIIGAGPGGYTAAFAAARAGLAVTLVERDRLGGVCLNHGCIPTKTLKASAEALDLALRLAEFGVAGSGAPRMDPAAVLARKERVCSVLRGGLEKSCAQHKIRLLRGRGALVSARQVDVSDDLGAITSVSGDAVLLATGSRVLELPGLAFDHHTVISSDDALRLDSVPARLLIVGGGVIGCEMAFIYRSFGADVTVVEGQSRLLPQPGVDTEISALLQREMKKRGIVCELNRTLKDLRLVDGGVQAVLAPSPLSKEPPARPGEVPVAADVVLVTVGRAPNTEGLGLSAAGVETDSRGWIVANGRMETSLPGVYAIGDVLGPQKVMLAHVAAMEGLCVVDNCLGRARDMDYSAVPSAIFTSPEIGCVGLSEAQAREQGRAVRCASFQMRGLGKAQAMGELAGVFKIVADEATDRVLGVHIAGAHATDLVAEAALALHLGATVRDIANAIHPHPTLAEGLYEAALALDRR
jgi:dihydrolipoamide dehydrogenase